MRYKIKVQFWGYSEATYFHCKDKEHRDKMFKEFINDYAITKIEYAKIYKDGTVGKYKVKYLEPIG